MRLPARCAARSRIFQLPILRGSGSQGLRRGGRAVSAADKTSGRRPLPARTRRLLEHGPRPGQYRGEYGAHAALVRQMYCAGWLSTEIADALRNTDNGVASLHFAFCGRRIKLTSKAQAAL